jgi:putative Mg2+ transporter-C (MgtC) family protein
LFAVYAPNRLAAEDAMNAMPLHLGWDEIALRLAATVIAGLVLGFDRSERGKAAGIRTTLLVCLAASVAMIQVNLLLPLAGRTADSFVMNDLMRFPLGILTGVGFIGGGAILRRDDLVVGVTTAATLWLATVVGLCLGAGQLGLGAAATALGVLALWGLQHVEGLLRQQRNARLAVEIEAGGPSEEDIRRKITAAGLAINIASVSFAAGGERRSVSFTLRYAPDPGDPRTPPLVGALARERGVAKVEWRGPL